MLIRCSVYIIILGSPINDWDALVFNSMYVCPCVRLWVCVKKGVLIRMKIMAFRFWYHFCYFHKGSFEHVMQIMYNTGPWRVNEGPAHCWCWRPWVSALRHCDPLKFVLVKRKTWVYRRVYQAVLRYWLLLNHYDSIYTASISNV